MEMEKVEGESDNSTTEPATRPLGSTELTLYKALAGGTGVTVIALLFSRPHETSAIQNALHHLQKIHPILRSRLHHERGNNTYTFVTSPNPYVKLFEFDAGSTSCILESDSPDTPMVQIVEHELNEDMWSKIHGQSSETDLDMFFAMSYELEDKMRVLTLKFLTAICDRTTGASVLKEFLGRLTSQDTCRSDEETISSTNEVGSAIEDLNPKPTVNGMLSTGLTLFGYTVVALGLTNLSFKDIKLMPRSSHFIRFQLDQLQTQNLLAGCESRGLKLYAALAAAGMMAAHSLNVSQNDNFGVVTVFDCRSELNPPLSCNAVGFYSSGILTSHAVKGSGECEAFWDLAENVCETFSNAKQTNKHFTDILILNFMLSKAIENPGVTRSTAQRTSLLAIFEEASLNEDQSELHKTVGVEDCIACASSHGVGPSISIYDTIQDGKLSCICIYPSPLHSKDQIVEIVDKMKNILIDESN